MISAPMILTRLETIPCAWTGKLSQRALIGLSGLSMVLTSRSILRLLRKFMVSLQWFLYSLNTDRHATYTDAHYDDPDHLKPSGAVSHVSEVEVSPMPEVGPVSIPAVKNPQKLSAGRKQDVDAVGVSQMTESPPIPTPTAEETQKISVDNRHDGSNEGMDEDACTRQHEPLQGTNRADVQGMLCIRFDHSCRALTHVAPCRPLPT